MGPSGASKWFSSKAVGNLTLLFCHAQLTFHEIKSISHVHIFIPHIHFFTSNITSTTCLPYRKTMPVSTRQMRQRKTEIKQRRLEKIHPEDIDKGLSVSLLVHCTTSGHQRSNRQHYRWLMWSPTRIRTERQQQLYQSAVPENWTVVELYVIWCQHMIISRIYSKSSTQPALGLIANAIYYYQH